MRITVLGAGTWGCAIARHLIILGHDVTIWSKIESEIDTIVRTHRHPNLKGVSLPEALKATADLAFACENAEMVVFAVPSVFVRQTARSAAGYLKKEQVVVDLAKGIEEDTYLTMTQIIAEELLLAGLRLPLVALSGPTHAEEVALDLPTTIVSASSDPIACKLVRDTFSSPTMRVYTSGDLLGVEICGALKNIIALAAGISAGIGYGDNAKAAIITRGMAEIARLGRAMGCNERTFYGLAGVGDLIVTATSVHSRNNRAGQLIGGGMSVDDACKTVGMVVEGLNALPAAVALCKRYAIDMPIVNGVDAIVNLGADPKQIVNQLMTRDLKNEALDS